MSGYGLGTGAVSGVDSGTGAVSGMYSRTGADSVTGAVSGVYSRFKVQGSRFFIIRHIHNHTEYNSVVKCK